MGLGKYAPNIALEEDTGWVHPSHRIWKCVTRQWCRSVNMCESRVNKRVFIWTCNLNKANTWCSYVKTFYRDRHRAHYTDIKMNEFQTNDAGYRYCPTCTPQISMAAKTEEIRGKQWTRQK